MRAFIHGLISSLTFLAVTTLQAEERIPFEIIPKDEIEKRATDADVVVISLVGEFKFEKDPNRDRFDATPAQMLAGYLVAVRNIHKYDEIKLPKGIDLKKSLKVYIAECGTENRHQPTRDEAAKLHQKLGLKNYDMSIPVIYVFHKGKIQDAFTYRKSPGWHGIKIAELAGKLLAK